MMKKFFILYHGIFTSGENLTKNTRWEMFEERPGLGGQHFMYLVQGIMAERFHKIKRTMTNLLVAHCWK